MACGMAMSASRGFLVTGSFKRCTVCFARQSLSCRSTRAVSQPVIGEPRRLGHRSKWAKSWHKLHRRRPCLRCCATLELTEENVERVLEEARTELLQLFDESVGITGKVTLVELDGPDVMLRLQGRFWHQRDMVLARMAAYLKQQIPEIMDVVIEDESQLDDSPENF